ncbi:MAG: hypothetical protein FE041_03710 [Thermoplasmata archaeon]|nr:MAG: hypothetical protein FE041_03710 [Thermoplasmata archaeon]
MDFNIILTIARKEFYEYLKTKRLLIIGGLYVAGFLLSVSIMSYYSSHSPNDFRPIIANAHSITSIFYILLPIVLSYDLIVRERSRKSIYLLLSKPVNREEVIFGKFLGVLSIICCVIIPIATIGHLITMAFCGPAGTESIARAYAYLGVIILGTACYISLSILFSIITKSTATSIISSLIVGWFGLNMIYPIYLIFSLLAGDPLNTTPWYGKLAYAISPSNDMDAAGRILSEQMMGRQMGSVIPITVSQAILALVIFFLITFAISTFIFRKKELV